MGIFQSCCPQADIQVQDQKTPGEESDCVPTLEEGVIEAKGEKSHKRRRVEYTPQDVAKRITSSVYTQQKIWLLQSKNKAISRFTWNNQLQVVRVNRVIDGDTIEIVHYYDLEGKHIRMDSLRIAGIDAPEMHPSKTSIHKELEKKAAIRVRDILVELFRKYQDIIYVHYSKEDKYGRCLGYVFIIEPPHVLIQLSKWLLEKQLVKSYDGGKKEVWTQEELEHIMEFVLPQ